MLIHTIEYYSLKLIRINVVNERIFMASCIENVWDEGLCMGCGTCAGICSNNAIEIKESINGLYKPEVNDSRCSNCGLCIKVCPGLGIDFNMLNKLIFGKYPKNSFVGNYITLFTAYSLDDKIRWNGTSGGLITSLLIFLLEEGIIDGVLVTKMSDENPLRPEVILARTREDIISASTSKYCPVAANIGLNQVLEEEGKFAVVGLPCHIHGIRKAEMIDKDLKNKIVLHIGLICSHTISFLGTEFLFRMYGIAKEDIKYLKYRGNGWPGGISIETKTGEHIFISYQEYWKIFSLHFFAPIRCMLCYDGANELSDLSFGDAWGLESNIDYMGNSFVIGRSEIGIKLLNYACKNNKIHLCEIDDAKLLRLQQGEFFLKKLGTNYRLKLLKWLGKKVPSYQLASPSNPISSLLCLGIFLFFIPAYFTSNFSLYKVMYNIPPPFLKKGISVLTYLRYLVISNGFTGGRSK